MSGMGYGKGFFQQYKPDFRPYKKTIVIKPSPFYWDAEKQTFFLKPGYEHMKVAQPVTSNSTEDLSLQKEKSDETQPRLSLFDQAIDRLRMQASVPPGVEGLVDSSSDDETKLDLSSGPDETKLDLSSATPLDFDTSSGSCEASPRLVFDFSSGSFGAKPPLNSDFSSCSFGEEPSLNSDFSSGSFEAEPPLDSDFSSGSFEKPPQMNNSSGSVEEPLSLDVSPNSLAEEPPVEISIFLNSHPSGAESPCSSGSAEEFGSLEDILIPIEEELPLDVYCEELPLDDYSSITSEDEALSDISSSSEEEFRCPSSEGESGYATFLDLKEVDDGSSSSSAFEVATGIPPGTIFQRMIPIVTNHVSAKVKLPTHGYYQYDVSIFKEPEESDNGPVFEPEEIAMSRTKSKDFTKALLPLIRENYYNRTGEYIEVASDFAKTLYTTKPLILSHLDPGNEYLNLQIDFVTDTGRSVLYSAQIKEACKIETSGMSPFLRDLIDQDFSQLILGKLINIERVLNVALKTSPISKMISVGRNSFYSHPLDYGFPIGGGLVNRTGFSLVYGVGWNDYVNVDVSNAAFYMGLPVLEVLRDLFSSRRSKADPHDITTWSNHDFIKANEYLRYVKMIYATPETKLTRKISGICRVNAQSHRFKNGEVETNVAEYFAERYGMHIMYPDGPLLETGNGSKIPAEFCTIKDGQVYNKRLSDSQTAAMIKDTAKPPHERMKMIQKALEACGFAKDPVLKEFNFEVGSRLHTMNARVIEPPVMIYRDKNEVPCHVVPTKEGCWSPPSASLFHQPAHKGEKLRWTILNVAEGFTTKEKIQNFFANFVSSTSKYGWDLGTIEEGMLNFQTFHPKDIQLWKWLSKMSDKLDFIFVVLGDNDNPTYSAIKKACETGSTIQRSMLTQCIRVKNVNYIRESVTNNVMMKVNTKLGGINHLVVYPEELNWLDVMQNGPVMIFGADVTHPAPGSKVQRLSLAGVTASRDSTFSQYNMVCRAQVPPKKTSKAAEIIQNLDDIVLELIQKFVQANGTLPKRLIFFRDGVGDGQFEAVLEKELSSIRRACNQAFAGIHDMTSLDHGNTKIYEPNITFVAVQKRHKTRFFCRDPESDGVGRPLNVPPGSVVDMDIVNPAHIDYYLLSHTGIQGTSKPTRYQVLWDDSNFTSDELQALTYYLCYSYARCNQSVSYPAPTYYAHLACTRARAYASILRPKDAGNLEFVNNFIERNSQLKDKFPMHFV